MMLAGQNDAAHVGRGKRFHNRIGIEMNGLEKVGVFIAIAPFFVGERIDREMEKRGGLKLMPHQLARRRDCAKRHRPGGQQGQGSRTCDTGQKCPS